jgi:hypothetical protein
MYSILFVTEVKRVILQWKNTKKSAKDKHTVPVSFIQQFVNNFKYSADTVLIRTTQVLERYLVIYINVL